MQISQSPPKFLVGVIADTHGQLASAAIQALQGSQLILHAGDLDTIDLLHQLEQIAPVRAIRGNMDRGEGVRALPVSDIVAVGEASLYILHDLAGLDLNPKAAGVQAVIHGHTHVPENTFRNEILFLNPGSASFPRRGSAPSVAILTVQGKKLKAEHIHLSN